jgi:glycosyltransferase involved in cell wall biosynthesis
MVGDGPKRDYLESIVRRLDISSNVVFTGLVDRDRVYRILSVSDFFIMMSRTEGHSVSLLEAMRYGCVPVLSRIPSFMETVDSDVAIFLENNDQLFRDVQAAAANLQQRKKLVRSYYRRQYSFETMMDNYYGVYKRLAARNHVR